MQTKTKLTGGQIIVETLIREGVPYIVGIPGHGPLGLSDALIKQDRLKVLQEIERKRDADSLAVFEPIAKRIWRPPWYRRRGPAGGRTMRQRRGGVGQSSYLSLQWAGAARQGAGWDMVRVVSRGGDQ